MFEPSPMGRVRVWVRPKPGHQYVLTVDPSSGGELSLSDDKPGDDSAVVVRDRGDREVVCTMRGRYPPYALKQTVYLLALWYNHAHVGVENNAGWGTPILEYLFREKGYEELYLCQRFDSLRGDYSFDLGWNTNRATRPLAFSTARGRLRDGVEKLHDPELINQLIRMQYHPTPSGDAKPMAPTGEKDDLALAWVINMRISEELGPVEPLLALDNDPAAAVPWHVKEFWQPHLDAVKAAKEDASLGDFDW